MKAKIIITVMIITLLYTFGVYAVKLHVPNDFHDLTNHYYIITGEAPTKQRLMKSLRNSHTNRINDALKYSGVSEISTTLGLLEYIPTNNIAFKNALNDLYVTYEYENSDFVKALIKYDRNKGIKILTNIVFNTSKPFTYSLIRAMSLVSEGVIPGYAFIEKGLSSSNCSERSFAERLLFNISYHENAEMLDGRRVEMAYLLKFAKENTNAYIVAARTGRQIRNEIPLKTARKNLWAYNMQQIITNSLILITNRLHVATLASEKLYCFGYDLIEPGLKSQDRNVKIAAEKLLQSIAIRHDGSRVLSSLRNRRRPDPSARVIDGLYLVNLAESNSCISISKERIEQLKEFMYENRKMRKPKHVIQ